MGVITIYWTEKKKKTEKSQKQQLNESQLPFLNLNPLRNNLFETVQKFGLNY